jgi:hypothetical protein
MIGYTVQEFKASEHYKIMSRWYESRNFPMVPDYLLPKTGLVVSHDGVYVCMGQLYRTDGSIATISHLVSSPVASGDERHCALDILLAKLIHIAKAEGFRMVTFATNLEKLSPRFEALGFVKSDENVTHFCKEL